MASKTEKKSVIRKDIIDSARIYSSNLAGKNFLYVYDKEYFEVLFPIDHFLHLTGVESELSAKNFYKNAKKGKITNNQFYFSNRHPYANAKKKLPYLKRLSELTNEMVCLLKDMKTLSVVYKLSLTNLEFTLGLTENINSRGKKVNAFFLPMSLRVEDSSVASIEYLYTDAGKFEDPAEIFGKDIPFIFTTKTFIVKWDGTIKAGIDVSKVKADINEATKEIIVHIPKAKILSHNIKDGSIETLDEKNGLFNKIKIDDIRKFDAISKKEMEKRAIENGLLDKAFENSKEIIFRLIDTDIVEELEYTIKFKIIEE